MKNNKIFKSHFLKIPYSFFLLNIILLFSSCTKEDYMLQNRDTYNVGISSYYYSGDSVSFANYLFGLITSSNKIVTYWENENLTIHVYEYEDEPVYGIGDRDTVTEGYIVNNNFAIVKSWADQKAKDGYEVTIWYHSPTNKFVANIKRRE